MPTCKICGEGMTAGKEILPGLDFSTRLWECLCGFKRNLFEKDEHKEWENSKRVESKVSIDSNYNYLHCLDKPDINFKGIPSKIKKCKCNGTCGNDCKCGKDSTQDKGCSGGGCSGCK